ncbi:transposable element Tcb2 transposase [Trichonephila clavipes]|nr:transposable element Tcb2 transposase [Trichonephila clavipes]
MKVNPSGILLKYLDEVLTASKKSCKNLKRLVYWQITKEENGTKSPKKAGYNGRVARKKPLIGKRNRVKRLKFAKEHILKPQQFWKEVIFSDECKFNIFGSDGRLMVWRKPNTSHHPKHTTPTVKHGESADKLGLGSNFIFQQDNDPKHTAFVVKEWLLYHCRNQLNTPPQSPDLNVIENLWSHLERAVQKHQITSKEQLKSVLQEEWLNIAPETTRHLVESMPR